MFFSLIESSNQVLSKTKVVDFLFLYNFYFGQISSSNINYFFEFWIVKFGSKSFKCVHCASLTTGPACHLLVSSRSSRIASVLKSSTAPLLLTASYLSRTCAAMVVAATSRATHMRTAPLPPVVYVGPSPLNRRPFPRAQALALPPFSPLHSSQSQSEPLLARQRAATRHGRRLRLAHHGAPTPGSPPPEPTRPQASPRAGEALRPEPVSNRQPKPRRRR